MESTFIEIPGWAEEIEEMKREKIRIRNEIRAEVLNEIIAFANSLLQQSQEGALPQQDQG